MATPGLDEPSGRETRLLVLVVAVALAVLLLLARFRFPTADLSVSPSSAPLAGLVARATFDEMAETLVGVFNRASSSVVVVALETPPEPAPARGTRRPATPAPSARATAPMPAPVQLAPALRVRTNLAVVYVASGTRPVAASGAETPIEILATDADRHLALFRIASRTAPDGLTGATRSFAGFAYVASVSATPRGPTVLPTFIGRADPIDDPRWPQGVAALGRAPNLSSGSLLFTMNARFIGMVADAESGLAIIPVPAIEAFVESVAGPAEGVPQ